MGRGMEKPDFPIPLQQRYSHQDYSSLKISRSRAS